MKRNSRLQQAFSYVKSIGLAHSQKDVAIAMGATPPNVSSALKGDEKVLTDKFLIRFNAAYDNIFNKEWLLTGEGEMLNDGSRAEEATNEKPFRTYFKEDREVLVPLINIDSVGGVHSPNLLDSSEQHLMQMVPLPNAMPNDVAILQSGESMSPTIPPGAILHIRRVEDWREYLGYGDVYVLWLRDNRRITKMIKKYIPDPVNYVLCCSYNENVDDEELPRKMIKEVWRVVNVLINKGW